MKTIPSVWSIDSYDVWGNQEEGYEVNDVYRVFELELDLEVKCFNQGTPQQFYYAIPSNEQIAEIWGENVGLDEGEDYYVMTTVEVDDDRSDNEIIYIKEKSTGKPVGEMYSINAKAIRECLGLWMG